MTLWTCPKRHARTFTSIIGRGGPSTIARAALGAPRPKKLRSARVRASRRPSARPAPATGAGAPAARGRARSGARHCAELSTGSGRRYLRPLRAGAWRDGRRPGCARGPGTLAPDAPARPCASPWRPCATKARLRAAWRRSRCGARGTWRPRSSDGTRRAARRAAGGESCGLRVYRTEERARACCSGHRASGAAEGSAQCCPGSSEGSGGFAFASAVSWSSFHGEARGRFRERLYGRTICTLIRFRYRESAGRRRPRRHPPASPATSPPGGGRTARPMRATGPSRHEFARFGSVDKSASRDRFRPSDNCHFVVFVIGNTITAAADGAPALVCATRAAAHGGSLPPPDHGRRVAGCGASANASENSSPARLTAAATTLAR